MSPAATTESASGGSGSIGVATPVRAGGRSSEDRHDERDTATTSAAATAATMRPAEGIGPVAPSGSSHQLRSSMALPMLGSVRRGVGAPHARYRAGTREEGAPSERHEEVGETVSTVHRAGHGGCAVAARRDAARARTGSGHRGRGRHRVRRRPVHTGAENRSIDPLDRAARRVGAGRPAVPGRLARGLPVFLRSHLGSVQGRTYPTPGNHEYQTPQADGTSRTSVPGRTDRHHDGSYAFDLGRWHLLSINTGDGRPDHALLRWVRRDLRRDRSRCELAYWHHPLHSSGHEHGGDERSGTLGRALPCRGRRGAEFARAQLRTVRAPRSDRHAATTGSGSSSSAPAAPPLRAFVGRRSWLAAPDRSPTRRARMDLHRTGYGGGSSPSDERRSTGAEQGAIAGRGRPFTSDAQLRYGQPAPSGDRLRSGVL